MADGALCFHGITLPAQDTGKPGVRETRATGGRERPRLWAVVAALGMHAALAGILTLAGGGSGARSLGVPGADGTEVAAEDGAAPLEVSFRVDAAAWSLESLPAVEAELQEAPVPEVPEFATDISAAIIEERPEAGESAEPSPAMIEALPAGSAAASATSEESWPTPFAGALKGLRIPVRAREGTVAAHPAPTAASESPVSAREPGTASPAPPPALGSAPRSAETAAPVPTRPAAAPAGDSNRTGFAGARPRRGSCPPPKYPSSAMAKGWEGEVELLVDIGADGAPASVVVSKTSGHPVLDDAAVAAVRRWRFDPATRGGAPVASRRIVPVSFRLR